MQLIEDVEHAGQGRLVAQLTIQCRNPVLTHRAQLDLHPFQALRQGGGDHTLHADMVDGRPIEGTYISGWAGDHATIIDQQDAKKHQQNGAIKV